MPSFHEQMLHMVDEYRAAGQPWPSTSRQLAAFALERGLYEPHQGRLLSIVADEFSRAMREQYIKDPQGRSVRAKHVARLVVEGEQKRLWDSIDTAGPEFMQAALQQRRHQIVGDGKQLKTDTDSYNENWNSAADIQMSFNFEADLEELELAATPTASSALLPPSSRSPVAVS